PFHRLPMNIAGEKAELGTQLSERLAPGLPVILFINDQKLAFGYSRGTWFQLRLSGDEAETRGVFTHFEPYLRRTFAGPTAEMEATLADAIAGKRRPPKANP